MFAPTGQQPNAQRRPSRLRGARHFPARHPRHPEIGQHEIERDTAILESLRNPRCSDTLQRNSNLFVLAARPESVDRYYAEHLIHRTPPSPQYPDGILVRSKSEVIVAAVLSKLGISYDYEQKLMSKGNPKDYRLPDFTVSYEGDTFYWEHLGMLSVRSYKEDWDRKRKWYHV